jgi:hypothetical protein
LDNYVLLRHIFSDKCIRTDSSADQTQLQLGAYDGSDKYSWQYETAADHPDKLQLKNTWASSGTHANNCMDLHDPSDNNLTTVLYTCGDSKTSASDIYSPSTTVSCPPGYFNNGTSCAYKVFGRGTGWTALRSISRCEDGEGVGSGGCEQWGGYYYPKCQVLAKQRGYPYSDHWTNDACCVCSPQKGYDYLSYSDVGTCPDGYWRQGAFCYLDCQKKYGSTYKNTGEFCSQIAGQGVESPGQHLQLFTTGFIYRPDGNKAIDTDGGTIVKQYSLLPVEANSGCPINNQHFDFVFHRLDRNIVRGTPFLLKCWNWKYLSISPDKTMLYYGDDPEDKKNWWIAEDNKWIGACRLRNVATGKYIYQGRNSKYLYLHDAGDWSDPKYYFRVYNRNGITYIQPIYFPGKVIDFGGQRLDWNPWMYVYGPTNDNNKFELQYKSLPIPRNVPITIRNISNQKVWTVYSDCNGCRVQSKTFSNDYSQKFIYTSNNHLIPLKFPSYALDADFGNTNELQLKNYSSSSKNQTWTFLQNGRVVSGLSSKPVEVASDNDNALLSLKEDSGGNPQNFVVPFVIRNVGTGKCFKVDSMTNTARYTQYACAPDSVNGLFYMRTNIWGNYQIRSFYTSKCLDGGSSGSNPLHQWDCDDNDANQVVTFANNIVNIVSKILSVPDNNNATELTLFTSADTNNQKFEFIYSLGDTSGKLDDHQGQPFLLRNGTQCLRATDSVDHAALTAGPCSKINDDMLWVFGSNGRIRNMRYGVCIDSEQLPAFEGQIVKTAPCMTDVDSSHDYQTYVFTADGTIQERVTGSKTVLDYNGNAVRWWANNNTGSQKWAIDSLYAEDDTTINDTGLLDLTVVENKELCPAGYTILSDTDLNTGTSGRSLYLCGKTGAVGTRGITAISVLDSKDSSCSTGSAISTDLNLKTGSSTDNVYICKGYTKATDLNRKRYVQDLKVNHSTTQSAAKSAPSGYSIVGGSGAVNLNAGAGGEFIYLFQNQPAPPSDGQSAAFCAVGDNIELSDDCKPETVLNTTEKSAFINLYTQKNGWLTADNLKNDKKRTRAFISQMSKKGNSTVDAFMTAYCAAMNPKIKYPYNPAIVLPADVEYTSMIQMKQGDFLDSSSNPTLTDSFGITLTLTNTGNLELRDWKKNLLWQTNSGVSALSAPLVRPFHLKLQSDGNLVISNNLGAAIWSSGSSNSPNTKIALINKPHDNFLGLFEIDGLCACINAKDITIPGGTNRGDTTIPGYCYDPTCQQSGYYTGGQNQSVCPANILSCVNRINATGNVDTNISQIKQECQQSVNNSGPPPSTTPTTTTPAPTSSSSTSGSGGSTNNDTKSSSSTLMIMIAFVAVIFLGLVGGGVYMWTRRKSTSAVTTVPVAINRTNTTAAL